MESSRRDASVGAIFKVLSIILIFGLIMGVNGGQMCPGRKERATSSGKKVYWTSFNGHGHGKTPGPVEYLAKLFFFRAPLMLVWGLRYFSCFFFVKVKTSLDFVRKGHKHQEKLGWHFFFSFLTLFSTLFLTLFSTLFLTRTVSTLFES